MSELQIRPLQDSDIPTVIQWARLEDFAPGIGDIPIYKNTDRQGIWLGWLGTTPIGCIAGVKYNKTYGFIGLYIVQSDCRGHGYGHQLWDTAINHLTILPGDLAKYMAGHTNLAPGMPYTDAQSVKRHTTTH